MTVHVTASQVLVETTKRITMESKKVTNTETNLVTTNDEGKNGEGSEAEAEVEAEAATNNLNNSNTAIIYNSTIARGAGKKNENTGKEN